MVTEDLSMRSDNREALEGFFRRMDAEFGDGLALRIIKLMVEELGGLRVSVPSYTGARETGR